ncbi:MAG: DinB family protein [Gemmatimonadetes bacterium]|nr:DinB family protein [Gemmatimonadota bacterium]
MRCDRSIMLLPTLLLLLPVAAAGQSAPPGFKEEFLDQFNASAEKLVALAQAMPAEKMTWRPMEGVYSVAQAYMHIARYNYAYPEESLGVPAPMGKVYDRWETDVTEKDEVVRILAASMDHVRHVAQRMSAADLEKTSTLYGRQVGQWSVLFQLLAHMNEHLGQSIAYARMNRVVPPWSR